MVNSVLDYAIDHSAVFAALLVSAVAGTAVAVIWIYERYHERATRRRGGLIG